VSVVVLGIGVLVLWGVGVLIGCCVGAKPQTRLCEKVRRMGGVFVIVIVGFSLVLVGVISRLLFSLLLLGQGRATMLEVCVGGGWWCFGVFGVCADVGAVVVVVVGGY